MNIKQNGQFFSPEQKDVKADIMRTIIDTYFEKVEKNKSLFDPQSILDLMTSVMATFNSVILSNTFHKFKLPRKDHKLIIKSIFEIVQEETKRRLKDIEQGKKSHESGFDKSRVLYEVIDLINDILNVKLVCWDNFDVDKYDAIFDCNPQNIDGYIAFIDKDIMFKFLELTKNGIAKIAIKEVH